MDVLVPTLLGLGFSDEQMAMPVMSLSGGQKAKLQLAKLLLSEANLLLLDEPTNHLDISFQSNGWKIFYVPTKALFLLFPTTVTF